MREIEHLTYTQRKEIEKAAEKQPNQWGHCMIAISLLGVLLILTSLVISIAFPASSDIGRGCLYAYFFISPFHLYCIYKRIQVRKQNTREVLRERGIIPKRCFTCKYPLQELNSPTACPECGEVLVTETGGEPE